MVLGALLVSRVFDSFVVSIFGYMQDSLGKH